MDPSRTELRFSEDHTAAIVDELNACAPGPTALEDWLARTEVQVDRVITHDDLSSLTLARRDEQGGRIVLMLLDGVWERAI